jgi:hypothetical protein
VSTGSGASRSTNASSFRPAKAQCEIGSGDRSTPGLAFAQLASYQHTLDFVTLSVLRNILVAWAAARGLLAEARNSALIVCQLGRKPPHATRT